MNNCNFCNMHEAGDDLYDASYWDKGADYERIDNIQYCPICGAKLLTFDEKRNVRRKRYALLENK